MLFQKLLDKSASILIGASSLIFAIVFFAGGRDIVEATKWLLIAMSISAVLLLPIYKRVQKTQWATIGVTLLFASITVFANNKMVFMWRSTITNTLIGVVFFGLYFFKKAPLEVLLGKPLELTIPRDTWIRLNIVWGVYMFVCGLINTIFVLFFSEEAWVAVKTFGIPALGFLFMGGMFVYLFQQDKRGKALKKAVDEQKQSIDHKSE